MFIVYCEHCREETEHLSIQEASAIAKISRRTVYHWIAVGKLHLLKNAGGHTLICRSSLFRPFKTRFEQQANP